MQYIIKLKQNNNHLISGMAAQIVTDMAKQQAARTVKRGRR